MLLISNKKNKINLSDYNYQQDLKNRLLMAKFSKANVDVLEEILNSSIKIKIEDLMEDLGISSDLVFQSIEIFEKLGLLKVEKDTLVVNKEMRKYYEFQILKFDKDFQANLEFVQGLLRKVPIHILPTWYNLPRTCDNIFQSIIEKYLLTPKTFERYFEELQTEDPILAAIAEEINEKGPITCEDLRLKHGLSEEDFVLYILHLEFNFLGFLSYRRIDKQWHEVLSPLHEWSEFCQFRNNSKAKAIDEKITPYRKESFAFIEDCKKIIKALNLKKSIEKVKLNTLIEDTEQENSPLRFDQYLSMLTDRLEEIKFIKLVDAALELCPKALKWLEMPVEEQAIYLFCQPSNYPAHLQNERSIRCIEKSLLKLSSNTWYRFDEFLKSLTCCIGHTEGVCLKKKGRYWKYEIPQYSEEEKIFVHSIIFERLFHAGIIDIASFDGKDVFRLNSFGMHTLT